MAESQPKCCNIDCGQLLFVEEEEWDEDAPGYEMGERTCVKTCDECKLKQVVEKFEEISYLSRPYPEPEEKTAETETAE